MRLRIVLLLLVAMTASTPGRAAELFRAIETEGMLSYLLYLPPGYEASDEPFALLFFLHGIVQKGSGSRASLQRVAADGPFRTMRDGRWDQRLPLIVVGPQSSGIQPWWRGEEVRKVFTHVLDTYRVDPTRRYLAGISMGGRSIWWLAKNFSDEFAAIVPVSGWAGDLSRSCDVFRGMGIWAFHGDRDPIVAMSNGLRPISVLGECMPPLTPAPHITVLDDVGHGQWPLVFQNDHHDTHVGGDGEPYSNIYRWLLSHQKPRARD